MQIEHYKYYNGFATKTLQIINLYCGSKNMEVNLIIVLKFRVEISSFTEGNCLVNLQVAFAHLTFNLAMVQRQNCAIIANIYIYTIKLRFPSHLYV